MKQNTTLQTIQKAGKKTGRAVMSLLLFCIMLITLVVPAGAANVQKTGVDKVGGYTYYINPQFDLMSAKMTADDGFRRATESQWNNMWTHSAVESGQPCLFYYNPVPAGSTNIGNVTLLFKNQASDAAGNFYDVQLELKNITVQAANPLEGPIALLYEEIDGALWIYSWSANPNETITWSGSTVTYTDDHAMSVDITTTILRHNTEIPAKGNVIQGFIDLDVGDGYTTRAIDHTTSETNGHFFYADNTNLTQAWPESVELIDGIRSDVYMTPTTKIRSNPSHTWFWGGATDSDTWDSGIAFLGNASGYTVRWRGSTNCGTKLFMAFDHHIIDADIEGQYPGGGYISYKGSKFYYPGANAIYTVRPNDGFYIDTMTIDGTQITPTNSYTFNNIQANHTISASFKPYYTVTYEWDGEHPDLAVPAQATNLKDGDTHAVNTTFYDGYTYTETNSMYEGVIYPSITWKFKGWDQTGTLTIHKNETIKGRWEPDISWPGTTLPVYNINADYFGTVRIQKNGKRVGMPDATSLEGAEFQAFEFNVNTGEYAETPSATATWDATTQTYYFSSLQFSYENQGRYKIVETKAPDGYVIGYETEVDITKTKNTELTGTKAAMDELNHVKINKVDGNTLLPLQGAVFTLDIDPTSPNYDPNTDYAEVPIATLENGEVLYGGDTVTSDENGEIMLYGLMTDTIYELIEITPPEDYGLNDKVFHIVVDERGYAFCPEDETEDVTEETAMEADEDYEFLIVNYNYVDIPLYKLDENGQGMKDVTFVLHIEEPEGQAHDHTITTDENGYVLIEKVYNGVYDLYEVKTKEGYNLLPYTVRVTVAKGKSNPEVIVIRNNRVIDLVTGGTGRTTLYIIASVMAGLFAALMAYTGNKRRKEATETETDR